jgi:hypothetical protein
MKYIEILESRLDEIDVGHIEHGDADKYYGYSLNGKLHTYPKNSDSYEQDMKKDWRGGNGNDNPIFKQDYSKAISTPSHFVVDNRNKAVNLNVDITSEFQSRRENKKIDSYNQEGNKDFYPIIDHNVSFKKTIDLIKNLKALVKIDSKTLDYHVIGDDRIPKNTTVRDIISNNVSLDKHTDLYDSNKDFIITYHGTSMKRASIILKQGLIPSKRQEQYGDLLDDYSEHNVYLTLEPNEAANYATREAINDGSNPVILKVLVKKTDFSKLRPDEDAMSWFDYLDKNILAKFFERNPILKDLELNFHIGHLDKKNKLVDIHYKLEPNMYHPKAHIEAKKIFKKYGLTTPEKIQAEEHKLYNDLMQTFVSGSFNKSFKENGTFAYKGVILPKFISMFKTWKIKGSKFSSKNSNDYLNAYNKQQATKQYFDK